MTSFSIAQSYSMMISTNKEKFSKFRNSVVLRVTLLMSAGALVWIIGMMQIDAWAMMTVPLAYLILSGVLVSICGSKIESRIGCKLQMIMSILFPCLFQIIAGGTLATGAVMVWSIVGLFSVVVYSAPKESLKWASYTFILIALTLAFENSPYYHFHSILNINPVTLLLFNVLATFLIIFYIIFFFVRTVDQVRRELSVAMSDVKELNESLQHKNDIHIEGMKHAAEIQNAFLKREDQLRAVFTKVFMLREIYNYVGGDFIWAEEKGGYKFVICGDCRTTGSSSGMLAMLMITAADRILKENTFTDPGLFLSAFNQKIHEMSSLDLASVKVNVSLSMLILRPGTSEVRLATAGGRIMVRKAGIAETSEVTITQVDASCIGGENPNKVFQSQALDLSSGDMVYMFTDGLEKSDQINGAFSADKIKELVRNFDTEYMFSQKRQLLKEIKQVNAQKENSEDILVCGFEIEME